MVGLEPTNQNDNSFQGCRNSLSATCHYTLDLTGIEPVFLMCKTNILPLKLQATKSHKGLEPLSRRLEVEYFTIKLARPLKTTSAGK